MAPKPPWSASDVALIRRFVATLRPARQSGSGSTSAEVLKLEKCKLVRLQRELLSRRYHDADKCHKRVSGLVAQVDQAFNHLVQRIAAELHEIPRALQTEHLHRLFEEMRTAFATGQPYPPATENAKR